MGIQVEFNPDLALRNISEFRAGSREREECIPEGLEAGQVHEFLKKGQRNYYLEGEIPLLETDGSQLSRPLASIVILEATHIMLDNELHTKGKYKVVEVFNPDDSKIHFDGFARIKQKA
ncbi:MAG: hypothetical protein ISS93_00690 [Candidatus Aenigmarchaeota archaeon]|nr:hypothetical protein [Candidatus Aenigmarchaeota archaeon]